MKKYIAIAVVLLVIIVGFFFFRSRSAKNTTTTVLPTTLSQTLNLPSDWQTITESNDVIKLEKTVTSGLKPQIVYKKTTSKDALTPVTYTDRVKAGARATLSGLVYLTDKRNTSGSTYSAFLTGYYFNRSQKILIDQRLYIQSENVFTLSASFDQKSATDAEINSIFDSIWSQHPAN
jgi:hypothetical protein